MDLAFSLYDRLADNTVVRNSKQSQSYYSTNFLKEKTISQISWIGSSAPFVHSTIGILVGKLYDGNLPIASLLEDLFLTAVASDGYFHHLMILGACLYVIFLLLLSYV